MDGLRDGLSSSAVHPLVISPSSMITEMAQRITQENSVMKLEKGMCGRSDYSGSEGEQMEAESSQNVYE